MFVHMVERRPNGIVVCGAKCQQTGSVNSHWHIFMPALSINEVDKDYWAVSFACPTDAEEMYMIYGWQSCDTRKLEECSINVGNAKFGGQEALAAKYNNVEKASAVKDKLDAPERDAVLLQARAHLLRRWTPLNQNFFPFHRNRASIGCFFHILPAKLKNASTQPAP